MRINFVTPSIVGTRATSPQPTEVGSASRIGAQTAGVPARPAQASRAGSDAIVSNVTAANGAVVPEPTGLGLIGAAAAMGLARRRRRAAMAA